MSSTDVDRSVLVTGASGLIGTALVDRLTAEGRRVIQLRRHPSPTASTATGGERPLVTTLEWDPQDGPPREELDRLGPIDAVVNLAGAGIGDRRWSEARKREVRESRITTTEAVVDVSIGQSPPPRVLVNASAVGYYGDRHDEILTESSARGSGFLAELCVDWETAASRAADRGIRTVMLRSGIVVSPKGGALGRQVPLFRFGLGGRLGAGTQYRSWISLEDEVSVILRGLDDGQISGPVNATAPGPVTDAEFAAALGRALHRPARLFVPATALRLALGTEMADEMLLSGQRVEPALLRARGFEFAHPTLDEALRWALAARQ